MMLISNIKRKQTVNLIYLLLVIVLTWRLPLTQNVRFNMNMMFMWATIFSLGLYISHTVNLWVGLFLSYSMISAYIVPTPESGATLLSVILGSILYLIFFNIFNKSVFITLFCLFAAANLFFIIAQVSGWDIVLQINKKIFLSDRQLRMGIVDNRNSLSAAFAFCFPVIFLNRWKWWLVVPIALFGTGFVLAKTVGGVLATGPAVLFYAHKYLPGKALVVGIVAMILAVSMYFKFVDVPNYKSRAAAWKMYGDLSQDPAHNKWFGLGLGHWQVLFKRKDIAKQIGVWAENDYNRPLYYKQAHNEVIQVHFEMGYIGLFIVLGYLISILRRVRHIKDPRPALILLAIIIDSLVYFPFHIPLLGVIILLGLAWLEKELRLSSA